MNYAKYVPYEKLSKKAQKARNAQRRGSWNGINPVTRVPVNSRAYQRAKVSRSWKEEFSRSGSSFLPKF